MEALTVTYQLPSWRAEMMASEGTEEPLTVGAAGAAAAMATTLVRIAPGFMVNSYGTGAVFRCRLC
jgi:hypothetical protein